MTTSLKGKLKNIIINPRNLHRRNQNSILKSREIDVSICLHSCFLWPDRQNDGQFIHRIDAHIYKRNVQKKIRPLSELGAEKSAFPPKRC